MGEKSIKRIVLYLLLVLAFWVFTFVTLNFWLKPYSIAHEQSGELTPGYLAYALIGLVFSTPAPFWSVLVLALCREKIGLRAFFGRVFHTEEKLKTVLLTAGFCLAALIFALLHGTPNGSPWHKLESLFDILNRVYFDNALPKPVITVQSTPKAYGHCSTKKIWKSENDGQYEINIGAEFLNRPSANTAATMCHEMVHLYCLVNEIQDTCQKGRYHNKTFKAEAEARDLEIGYDRTVGFSHTNPTEAFKKTLEDSGFVLEVPFARVMPEEKAKAEREKPHRYVCPACGQEVKTTADLSLICGICEVAMERAD